MSRNFGCITVMMVLSVPCLAVLAVGLRIGLAYDYTFYDWVSIVIPAFNEPGDFARWLMLLPVILIPLVTLGLIIREFVRAKT